MDYKNINDYEVLYQINEKDDLAEDIMYKKYFPIIRSIASKYLTSVKDKGLELDDLIQEGNLGLSNAIRTYRDNQNTLFYSYACLCIERQINTYCRKISSRKHEILNNSYFEDAIIMNKSNDYELNNLDNLSINIIDYEDFLRYKNCLDLKYSTVFELRYNGFTYKEISELLDLSISTVDGRLSRIRKTLHNVIKKTT